MLSALQASIRTFGAEPESEVYSARVVTLLKNYPAVLQRPYQDTSSEQAHLKVPCMDNAGASMMLGAPSGTDYDQQAAALGSPLKSSSDTIGERSVGDEFRSAAVDDSAVPGYPLFGLTSAVDPSTSRAAEVTAAAKSTSYLTASQTSAFTAPAPSRTPSDSSAQVADAQHMGA